MSDEPSPFVRTVGPVIGFLGSIAGVVAVVVAFAQGGIAIGLISIVVAPFAVYIAMWVTLGVVWLAWKILIWLLEAEAAKAQAYNALWDAISEKIKKK